MSNNEDEVSNILSAKLSIKFNGVEIEAMKVELKVRSGLKFKFRRFALHHKHVMYISSTMLCKSISLS